MNTMFAIRAQLICKPSHSSTTFEFLFSASCALSAPQDVNEAVNCHCSTDPPAQLPSLPRPQPRPGRAGGPGQAAGQLARRAPGTWQTLIETLIQTLNRTLNGNIKQMHKKQIKK